MRNFAATMAQREPPVLRSVRRTLLSIACVYLVLASWSCYRRIWQILHIELHVSAPTLTPGSTVGYDVVASGETQNRIRLELVQYAHREILVEQRASVNEVSALDPRVFRYIRNVTLTPSLLARFHSGPATLRVTGFGGQKLLHTPAPRVRELQVQLQP